MTKFWVSVGTFKYVLLVLGAKTSILMPVCKHWPY